LSSGFGKPIWPRRASWTKVKYAIYPVAADEAKLWTATRLKIDKPGAGYCHFPAARSQDWYVQLSCERLVIERGQRKWTNPLRQRNEATDCRALAACALHSRLLSGVNLNAWCEQFEAMLAPPPIVSTVETIPKPNGAPPPVHRSRWMDY
jgi:phage terminase large subunit GpA-like protein